jgi:FO synthase
MFDLQAVLDCALNDVAPSDEEALELAQVADAGQLLPVAAMLRDKGFNNVVTFSKKVFIPLTHLCRDVCHYCTFAQAPKKVIAPYLTIEQVLETTRHAVSLGCKEALFTLGEKPELRYKTARDALATMGYESTVDYLHDVAQAVFDETGLLPHLNPGTLSLAELERLRGVSPSMGIMPSRQQSV